MDLCFGGNMRSMSNIGRFRSEDYRLRLSPAERAELLALKSAAGSKTMVDFIMAAARLAAPPPVDRGAIAALSSAVSALAAAPEALRALRAELVESRDVAARAPSDDARRAFMVEVRALLPRINEAVGRLELESEPLRSMFRSAVERLTEESERCIVESGRIIGGEEAPS